MTLAVSDRSVQAVSEDSINPVVQFSFFLGGRNPSFSSLLKLFSSVDAAVLALCFLDNSETEIVRCVVNYPHVVRKACAKNGIYYAEANVIAVDMDSIGDMVKVVNTISAAEIRILYAYAMLTRPSGKTGLIMQTEDNAFSSNTLGRMGIRVITQNDIGR